MAERWEDIPHSRRHPPGMRYARLVSDGHGAVASATELREAKAIHAAVAAIYFMDSSDYRTALYDVVHALDYDVYSLLCDDPNAAFTATDTRLQQATHRAEAELQASEATPAPSPEES